jgi:hypothetical protein
MTVSVRICLRPRPIGKCQGTMICEPTFGGGSGAARLDETSVPGMIEAEAICSQERIPIQLLR